MSRNQSSITGKFTSKEFAAENKDTTAAIKSMNGLTKIFDLVREGKHDEAKQRIGKLSVARAMELLVAVTWIETVMTDQVNPNAPNGTQRPVNTRG